ncbi:hypothetical protein BTM25_43010 [Actinomadura rubteroloni]|uniref:AAA+ ATPase domain-containing protein n=1 Tax=Actinomadura rubteroloni TaxID=1926885 RepID=A0A2P4UDM6_9ACTN|nr:AAA family ATPase [Actinomadura rubteroloni]POM23149.1 hypothetical protein BTM25_43010 [Actinomadura rubteroloni]
MVEPETTVARRLAGARRRRFVGRAREVDLFREALTASRPAFAVLYVHGPGGVGKTALLAVLAQEAERRGAGVVRMDGRALEPGPFRVAFAEGGRPVLFIDTYEAIGGLDDWVRETLVPGLPENAVVVIAGRRPPGRGWAADPGWRELLRVVRLGHLSAAEVREYARAEGLPEDAGDRLTTISHGHPLALVLLTDAIRTDGTGPDRVGDLREVPAVVGRLAECFVDGAPGDLHRRALQACALARFTTEPLLRAALGEDAGALFGWLRGLPFMEEGPLGLFPHDLVRDVVAADLRWRDPAAFAVVHYRIRDHLMERVRATAGEEQFRWVLDACFLVRANPLSAEYWEWGRLAGAYTDLAGPGDRAAILATAARYEGAEAAELTARWMDHPQALTAVFRGPESFGFSVVLRLRDLTEADLAADPVVAACWRHVCENGPLEPAEEVVLGRFYMDRDDYQGPGATRNTAMAKQIQRLMSSPLLAYDFICAFTGDPDAVAPLLAHIGYVRLPGAERRIGGTRYTVFVRDWRGRTVRAWLDMVAEHDLGRPPAGPAEPVLPREEFAAEVKRALRDLRRPDALLASPLLGCRVAGPGDPGALRDALRAAVAELREEKPRTALECAFLRGAPTQERAAEILGLPLSTYRRHLARGVARVVELLWDRENEHRMNW